LKTTIDFVEINCLDFVMKTYNTHNSFVRSFIVFLVGRTGLTLIEDGVIAAAHPSPLSVTKFWGCKVFSKANKYLTDNGKTPVDWKLPEDC
jgi:uracil DNA glycosylase